MDMEKLPLNVIVALGLSLCLASPSWAAEPGRSSPKDTRSYSRPAIPGDTAGPTSQVSKPQLVNPLVPSPVHIIRVIDTVVNNTDPNLTNTDLCNDGATSIAINPLDPHEIVISAFSGPSTAVACSNGSWIAGSPNAPIWHSTDNGPTRTKTFTVPAPPGAGGTLGCPCDQALDYGLNNVLFGTFLTFTPTNVFIGS